MPVYSTSTKRLWQVLSQLENLISNPNVDLSSDDYNNIENIDPNDSSTQPTDDEDEDQLPIVNDLHANRWLMVSPRGHLFHDDGQPDVLGYLNAKGLKLIVWRYVPVTAKTGRPSDNRVINRTCSINGKKETLVISQGSSIDWNQTKGAIVVLHGAGQHARVELLAFSSEHPDLHPARLNALPTSYSFSQTQKQHLQSLVTSTPLKMQYEGGLAEYYNSAGYVVYGLDLIGHGLSDFYQNQLGGIDSIDSMTDDVVQLLWLLRSSSEVPFSSPLFLQGVSMGGLIAYNTLARPSVLKTAIGDGYIVSGGIFVSPAFSFKRFQRTFPNNVLIPFGSYISKYMPTLKFCKYRPSEDAPFIFELWSQDKFSLTGAITNRIVWEIYTQGLLAESRSKHFSPQIPLLFVVSKSDTVVDCEGASVVMERLEQVHKKELYEIDGMWHIVTREPGCDHVRKKIVNWIMTNTV